MLGDIEWVWDHVLVQKPLLLQRFPQVTLELLVVWDAAGVVGWGDVLGHGVWNLFTSFGVVENACRALRARGFFSGSSHHQTLGAPSP